MLCDVYGHLLSFDGHDFFGRTHDHFYCNRALYLKMCNIGYMMNIIISMSFIFPVYHSFFRLPSFLQ